MSTTALRTTPLREINGIGRGLARLGGVSHGPGVDTFGLVLHPTKPVGESIETITAWAREHGSDVLAREQDRRRMQIGRAHV